MNYADSMSAYRWRIHNCNLSSIESNCIFLYSPIVLQASRMLSPELRQDGKLYFDMTWELEPKLCFIPFENREYNPILFSDFPEENKQILSNISGITGNIVSEHQTNFLDNLLPTLKNDLIDMLPEETFEFKNKEAVIQSLSKEKFSFDKSSFPLINLYGVAQWHQVIGDLNERY